MVHMTYAIFCDWIVIMDYYFYLFVFSDSPRVWFAGWKLKDSVNFFFFLHFVDRQLQRNVAAI